MAHGLIGANADKINKIFNTNETTKSQLLAAEKKEAKEGNLKYLEGTGGPDTDSLSNAFTVIEPETGKRMTYDSKEIFLGHRNQKKPKEYDMTNITEVQNTNVVKFKHTEKEKEISVTDLLLSRVTC